MIIKNREAAKISEGRIITLLRSMTKEESDEIPEDALDPVVTEALFIEDCYCITNAIIIIIRSIEGFYVRGCWGKQQNHKVIIFDDSMENIIAESQYYMTYNHWWHDDEFHYENTLVAITDAKDNKDSFSVEVCTKAQTKRDILIPKLVEKQPYDFGK